MTELLHISRPDLEALLASAEEVDRLREEAVSRKADYLAGLDALRSEYRAKVDRLRAQRAALYAQVARLTQLATVARQERLPVSADLIFGALKESGSRRTDWREICEACGVNDFDHRPGCPILAEERSLTSGDEVQP